mgnify:CR=1 FL=1
MSLFNRVLGAFAILACVPAARGLLAQDDSQSPLRQVAVHRLGSRRVFRLGNANRKPQRQRNQHRRRRRPGSCEGEVSGRFAARFRIGHRHELELGYLLARRKGDNTLSRDIVFTDTTYTAGMHVKSVFNADNLFLNYRYAFVAKEGTQVGAATRSGRHPFKTSIEAEAGSEAQPLRIPESGA